jgi:hypothetical protein
MLHSVTELTQAAFYDWRSDRDYRAEIKAKRARGEKLDTRKA